jgi:hypothetical protein
MREPVGNNDVHHEDNANDDEPEGICHHAIFKILCVQKIININVDKLLDNNDDNPDEDFGETEVKEKRSRKFVSAREYYCFKLQVRKKLFNIILFGGRLFQQWAIDMYIKIETMRLDWYSKPENQKVIRADLYQVTVLVFI